MGGRCTHFCILFGILISNPYLKENFNAVAADVIISDTQALKSIEVIKASNSTLNPISTPTLIQHGNNLFVQPKFFIGSPFTSYKQDKRPDDSVALTSRITSAKSSIAIGNPGIPQLPTIPLPLAPHGMIPTGATSDISAHLTKILNHPRIPITLPNLSQSMASPPKAVPISPYFPQLLNYPIVTKKPVRPVVIPEPPKLPPMILPKLPIQVTVQRPIIPMPNHRIAVSPLCPPKERCFSTERDPSSVYGIFGDIFQNFQNLQTTLSETDSTMVFSGKQTFTSNLTVAFPTLCAQGIIAERVVPNIVTNEKTKVFMSPISPSQLPHLNYYKNK